MIQMLRACIGESHVIIVMVLRMLHGTRLMHSSVHTIDNSKMH